MFSISSGGGRPDSPEAATGVGLPMNRRSIIPPRKLAVVVGSTGTGTGTSGAVSRGRCLSPSRGSGGVGALAVDLALRCE
eukprot:1726648-Heterocapsa_arctica.AAC.1